MADRAVLALALALAVAASGCGDSGGPGGGGGTGTTGTTETTGTTGSFFNNTTGPPAPVPSEIFNATFEFKATGNTPPKTATVKVDALKMEYFVVMKVRANGPVYVQGSPGAGDANIEFKPPSGSSTKQSMNSFTLPNEQAGRELQRYRGTILKPKDGDWSVIQSGIGENVDVLVVLTQFHAPPETG